MMTERRATRPKKRYSQAARLHNIIRILEARHGVSIDELADECGVTRRTVFRDLAAVAEAGFPLVNEKDAEGRALYSFMTQFRRSPPVTFSLEELMTLYFCRGQLAFLQGTPFQADLDDIFNRIRAGLPPRSVAHLERIASAAAPRFQGVRDYRDKSDLLRKLRHALLYQYRCEIGYRPPQRDLQSYLVDPYTLLFFNNSMYLGGYAHNRGALRLFLVDRLESIVETGQRFEVPEDYAPDDLTGSAFGLIEGEAMTMKVRFGAAIAHLIRERIWHPSQVLEEGPDGTVDLTLEVSGEREILAWLYSYLPDVDILHPPELQRQFRAGLENALERSTRP